MERAAPHPSIIEGFGGIASGELVWFCDPACWAPEDGELEGAGGKWHVDGDRLVVAAPSKKDFWRKTYYDPILVKDVRHVFSWS